MKNTAMETFCDRGIVYSLCALIFVLPASIALLDSYAALTISFYLLKKINRMCLDWPWGTSNLNFLGKAHFIWKSFAPPVNFLNLPLQLLCLAVFMSVLFSQYPDLSFMAFLGKFLKAVFLYFSFIEAFNDRKSIRIFLFFFLASAFITALSGGIQHYTGRDFIKGHLSLRGHLIVGEHYISDGRINSSFYGVNGFGAYLLPVIGLFAHILYTAIAHHKSWILGGSLVLFMVLLLACLCWTYSRSSWIGYLIILFLMVCMDHRKILYAGALLLVFIFIFLPSLNNVRHVYLINDNSEWFIQKSNSVLKPSSVQKEGFVHNIISVLEQGGSGRRAFWKKAISIIRAHPLCGAGLNTYTRIIKRDPDRGTWWYAHNSYLQMAAETGLVGLACFLWMLFVLMRHGLNYCKLIRDLWPLTYLQGAVSGLFGYLVQSFFDNTFYAVQLSVLLWVMIGLMVAVTRLNGKEASLG